MNGNRILLDSNIIIYTSQRVLQFEDIAKDDDVLYMPVITNMEVLGYEFEDEGEETIVSQICENIGIIYLNNSIRESVIYYRKKKRIKLPDSIILATASVFNCILITRNKGDFEGFDTDVEIVVPFE